MACKVGLICKTLMFKVLFVSLLLQKYYHSVNIHFTNWIAYRDSKGSPRQFMLWVAARILFIFAWTYRNPTATRGSIFKKEADTRMETTFSGCKEGYSCCEEDLLLLRFSLSSLSLPSLLLLSPLSSVKMLRKSSIWHSYASFLCWGIVIYIVKPIFVSISHLFVFLHLLN